MVVDQDIIAYKGLLKVDLTTWMTPFKNAHVRWLDLVCHKDLVANGTNFDVEKCSIWHDAVHGGAIHCALDRVELERWLKDMANGDQADVFKVIIPRGTEFYADPAGIDIAARKIRFVKRVSTKPVKGVFTSKGTWVPGL